MEIQALGYVGIGASDLTDWTEFATNWLGMQMVERGNACRAFRMDDRKQRLVVDRSLAEGERYFGFEVADAAALDGLAARLEAAGVPVQRRARHAGGSTLRARVDQLRRSGREPAGGVLGRGGGGRGIPARAQHLGLPHGAARHGPRRSST